MNKHLRITTAGLVLFSIFILPQQTLAQWSIGASYEIRQEAPENGFGARIERNILGAFPLADIKLRGHFSYFSENNYVGRDGSVSYGSIENYDFGLAAVGGISLGLITPYVGTGLGSTTTDLKDAQFPNGEDESESRLFWNGFGGVELSLIPAIKPFVEYRLKAAQSFEEMQNSVDESNGRLIFGVSLAF